MLLQYQPGQEGAQESGGHQHSNVVSPSNGSVQRPECELQSNHKMVC